ncbi:MAG: ABC transporter substrate-binding protein [Sphaerochaetaceae bacterium]|nr:ABC transporter substrate-binding protein [Sphaerochaetaceae bacterium]MDC7250294.1 ABC transporter substrate-binding protein [Sphaerochaetaceae bacterium]
MKISEKDFLYNIIDKYPQTKDYFILNGVTQVENDKLLSTLGKTLKLETLIKSKKLNQDLFLEELNNLVENKEVDSTLVENEKNAKADIKLTGILPCPVRIPLLESFEKWLDENNKKDDVDFELKAASMGVDWLKDSMNEESLSDIFLSAGFDLFFDDKYMNQFKKRKIFKDLIEVEKYNEDFDNDYLSLKDPDGDYSIISVVPAVFLVNDEVLKDKKAPTSWEELISGDFDNSVSLPIGDFDLFNAILLNIYKRFGLDGVRRLGKTLLKSMHPSQMVKSNVGRIQPSVTIMPYFFTKMAKFGGPMNAIWPEDGAIISPIFMLTKAKKEEKIKEIAEFFASKEVGEILSHTGLFPSTHPEVNNNIDKKNKYMWVGWQYIKENDIGNILETCIEEFNKSSEEIA